MSIYGKSMLSESYQQMSEIEKYLDESFLASCLDESVAPLYEMVEDLTESTTQEEFTTSIQKIMESDLCFERKLELVSKASSYVIGESTKQEESGILSESVILEFQGNAKKNEEFINCLKDLEKLCNFNVEKIRKITAKMNKFITIANEIVASPKKFKDKLQDAKATIGDYNKWYNEASKELNQLTWKTFDNTVRKFNNKYSEVTMEEKKKLDNKLSKLDDEINDLVIPWCKDGESINKLYGIMDKMLTIDEDYSKTFGGVVQQFYDVLIQEANYTNKDILYARKAMGIEKERGFVYKFINKIFR